jgi:hypothetical protein
MTGSIHRGACALFLAGTIFGLGQPVRAQQPSSAQVSAIRSACPADYRAHCANVPPGGSASLACLRKNLAGLSPACRQAVGAVSEAAPAAAATSPIPPAPQAPAAPAASGTATTPAAPAAAPTATTADPEAVPLTPREELAILRVGCRADYRSLCGNVVPGGGRAIACLRANKAALSPGCISAIQAAQQR